MSFQKLVRRVESIHLGDGRSIGPRAIEMEWHGELADETEDLDEDADMETLAVVRFAVNAEEYAQMARLGLVDAVPPDDEDEERSARVAFRTDPDLLDDAEDTLREEWEESLDSASEEPTIWNDLDYWEVLSID